MNNDEIATLLETTADRYESGVYGWVRNFLCDDHKTFCSIGGLSYTARGEAHYELPEVAEAAKAMMKVIGIGPLAADPPAQPYVWENLLVNWNDKGATGLDHVVDVMKQAAKNLRSEA